MDYAGSNYSDAGWLSAPVPGSWTAAPVNYANTSGFGWYRRHVAGGTPAQVAAAEDGTLNMAVGTVSGSHEVYLNGLKIGGTILHETKYVARFSAEMYTRG
jgi:hypothetical protein